MIPGAPCYDAARMAHSRAKPPGRMELLALAGIFLAALIPRLLYLRDIHAAGLGEFLRLDPLYYQEWALRIAAGDWLGREVFEMSPLYPYALGLLYRIFGVSLTLPKVLQAVLGALTCAGTALLGRRLFGRSTGLVAGLGLAFYGPAIYYDGQINKTTLALALTVTLAGALSLSEGRRPGWIAAGGFTLGLAALVHENLNVAAPVLVLWLLSPLAGGALRERLGRTALFVAAYAVTVLPVTARNVAVAGEFVLITSAGGENFYTGNNEQASGRYRPPAFVRPDPFFEHEDFRREAARRLGRPLTRKEASRFWWHEGLRFIRANPGRALWLLWDKFGVFFNGFERPDNFSYYNFRLFSPTLALPWLSFGVVAPLALFGIVASADRWRELIPVYAAMGAFILSALIFFIQSRYRMPAVPFFLLFAAFGLAKLADLARERRLAALGTAAAAIVAAFLFVNRDPGNAPEFHAQNDLILGELYHRADRLDEAAGSFRSGLRELEPAARAGNPVFARIVGAGQYGLGLTERRRGHLDEAEEALRAASECPDPDVRADALLELAALLERSGNLPALAETLERAVAARPGEFRLRLRRAETLYKLGRIDESLEVVRGALSFSPAPPSSDLAEAWYGMALIQIRLGDQESALEALRRTLELNPRHPSAGRMLRRLGARPEDRP